MYRAQCRIAGRLSHTPLLYRTGCCKPTQHQGRVALFTTSKARTAAKKGATVDDQGAADQNGTAVAKSEAKNLASWTTLREKLEQAHADKLQVESIPRTESKSPTPKSAKSAKSTKSAKSAKSTKKSTKAAKGTKVAKTAKKKDKKKPPPKEPVEFAIVTPQQLELHPIEREELDIPKLAYGLDRVLFNEGVYRMQDIRTLVYNFDPYLASIMPVEEFDYDALKQYITSSKDAKLRELASEHGKKYSGSTSSMTSILSHLHYLISAWRLPNLSHLSRSWTPESNNFTILTRGPVATFLKYEDGIYSIDSDKQYDNDNILSMLGKSMEKLLTLPKEEFEKYKKTRSHQLTDEEKNADEAYHYTTFGDFIMRSQLDAHDPRLPGSGVFDLKTRAVVSIRMDVQGHEKGAGYEIRKQFGEWESFEREYYDLIRAAFLKYSLQVRMGRMDGIFVAYHNTLRIFGFQYVPLSEMDHAIHGQSDTRLGDEEFKASLAILNDLLDRATKKFPNRTLRLHVETRPTVDPMTYFFVEPVSDEEMRSIQESNNPSVEQLKEELHDLSCKEKVAETAAAAAEQNVTETEAVQEDDAEDEADLDSQNEVAWQEVMERVNEAVESESLGIRSVREALQDALTHSGLLEGKTEVESEKHISDLVSALTAHSQESRALETASEEEPEESQGADDETPLKDLILRVTKGIDENTANLNEFQRMFAGLAEKSNEQDNIKAKSESDAEVDASSAAETSQDTAEHEEAAAEEEAGVEGEEAGVEGEEAVVEGEEAVVEGEEAGVKGEEAVVEGEEAGVKGEEAVVEGEEAGVEGEEVGVEGEEAVVEGEEAGAEDRELLGMYLTIRNKVDGKFVTRPERFGRETKWEVQYAVKEIPHTRAVKIYQQIKARRRKILDTDATERAMSWHRMFAGNLPALSKRGETYRAERAKQEELTGVRLAWERGSASSSDASSPEASSPDASSPEASSPEASSPEASSPEASSPEASSPEASSPDASSSDASSSDASSSDAS